MDLQDAGWTPEERLDFDLGMLWFDQWVEGMRNEMVEYEPSKDQKQMAKRPRYETLSQIFEQYDSTRGMTQFTSGSLPGVDINQVIEMAYADDVQF